MATGVYKAIRGYKVPRGIGELLHERSTNYNLRGKHILELPKVYIVYCILYCGPVLGPCPQPGLDGAPPKARSGLPSVLCPDSKDKVPFLFVSTACIPIITER